MQASKRGFLIGLSSFLAAPAIVRADSLMQVRSIVKPYATVWGVGWDLEVVEHTIWTPDAALKFANFDGGGIERFREVTEVVYTNSLPLPLAYSNHWTERSIPKDPMDRFARMQRGKFETVPCPTPEHPHAVRFEPVTVFDDPKELEGKHPYVRNWASDDMAKSTWEEVGIWV